MANLFDGHLVEAGVGVLTPLVSVAIGTVAARRGAGALRRWGRDLVRTSLIWLPALGVFLATLGPVALHEAVEGPVLLRSFHVQAHGERRPKLDHFVRIEAATGHREVRLERGIWAGCPEGARLEKAAWSWTVACDGIPSANLRGFWLLVSAFLLLALAPAAGAWVLARRG